MIREIILLSACTFALAADAAEGRFELVGEPAAGDAVVAVPLGFDVYRACGAGEGRLERELRVRDSAGSDQPYVIRDVVETRKGLTRHECMCAIRDFAENADGTATLVAEFQVDALREGDAVREIVIGTPLVDFEQKVTVSPADGTGELAEGAIYDYSRFAPVRKLAIPVVGDLPRRFRVTFKRPVTEVEKAEFERTVQSGSDTNLTVRRTVTEQAFRVDSIRVAYDREATVTGEALRDEVELPGGEVKRDEFEYETFSAPIVSVTAIPNASTWAFRVIAGGRPYDLHAFDLPGRRSSSCDFRCEADPVDGVARFRIDWNGNPRVGLGTRPFRFAMTRREIVFAVRAGESYHLAFARGAETPNCLREVRDYLASAKPVRTLELRTVGEFAATKEGKLHRWLRKNGVSVAGVIALVALLSFCLKTFSMKS